MAFTESKKSLVLRFFLLLLSSDFSGILKHESQGQSFLTQFTTYLSSYIFESIRSLVEREVRPIIIFTYGFIVTLLLVLHIYSQIFQITSWVSFKSMRISRKCLILITVVTPSVQTKNLDAYAKFWENFAKESQIL